MHLPNTRRRAGKPHGALASRIARLPPLQAHPDAPGSIWDRCLAQKRTPEGAAQPGTGVPILGSQSTWEVAEIVVG